MTALDRIWRLAPGVLLVAICTLGFLLVLLVAGHYGAVARCDWLRDHQATHPSGWAECMRDGYR